MDATSDRPRSPLDLPPPPASVLLHPSAPPPPPPPVKNTEIHGNTTTTTTTQYVPKSWNDPTISTSPKIPVSSLSGAQPLPSILNQKTVTSTSSYLPPSYSGKHPSSLYSSKLLPSSSIRHLKHFSSLCMWTAKQRRLKRRIDLHPKRFDRSIRRSHRTIPKNIRIPKGVISLAFVPISHAGVHTNFPLFSVSHINVTSQRATKLAVRTPFPLKLISSIFSSLFHCQFLNTQILGFEERGKSEGQPSGAWYLVTPRRLGYVTYYYFRLPTGPAWHLSFCLGTFHK